MILDFLLSPITDKNTFTGAIIDSYSKSKDSKKYRDAIERQELKSLRIREIEALEKIAKICDK